MRNFPYTKLPTGWFQLCWADELSPGDVKPLQYFDTDLVLLRTESGRVAMFDAFCRHMGAHLGHGGRIKGEQIECPFHGWCYDAADGSVADVPYAERHPKAKLSAWEVRESMGMLFAWHDANRNPPSWDPPNWPEPTSSDYFTGPAVRRVFPSIRVQPQAVIENVMDAAHQQFVHGAVEPAELVEYRPDGPVFHILLSLLFGGKGKKTWLTDRPTKAQLEIEAWGTGVGLVRFHGIDGAVIIHTSTPIDHDRSDLRSQILVRTDNPKDFEDGKPVARAIKRIEHQMRQVDQDIVIWENMSYVRHPLFAGGEIPSYSVFRRWTDQFYSEARVRSDDQMPAGVAQGETLDKKV